MPFEMNNTRPRLPASQVGAGASLLSRLKEKTNGANDSSTNKEGIVQKLQGVLFAVRRDRDREHRNRDIAMEKLRSAKEVFQAEKSNFEAEKEKLAKTQEEAEKTQQEILQKEVIIQQLQQKYQFQHEDLLRKRQKIQQQTNLLEAAASERNKLLLDVRSRLDRQRNKYHEMKQTEDQESENLLATILSLASRETNDMGTPKETKDVQEIQSENGTSKETADQNKSRPTRSDLHKFLDDLEARKEAALIKEFQTSIDYDMIPSMISQKAQALKMEIETMLAEISHLEAVLNGTAKSNGSKEQGQEEQSDTKTNDHSKVTFEADVSTGVAEDDSMWAEATQFETLLDGTKNRIDSQQQGQQPNTEMIVDSESTYEVDVGTDVADNVTVWARNPQLDTVKGGTEKDLGSQGQGQRPDDQMNVADDVTVQAKNFQSEIAKDRAEKAIGTQGQGQRFDDEMTVDSELNVKADAGSDAGQGQGQGFDDEMTVDSEFNFEADVGSDAGEVQQFDSEMNVDSGFTFDSDVGSDAGESEAIQVAEAMLNLAAKNKGPQEQESDSSSTETLLCTDIDFEEDFGEDFDAFPDNEMDTE